MFPDEIAKIAVIAIKCREWHTFDALMSEFYCWMDRPNDLTGKAAAKIGSALDDTCDSSMIDRLKQARTLLEYAVKSLMLNSK